MNFANPSMRMGNLGRKATPFKTFIENVGKKLSPLNISERAEGMMPGKGKGWFNKVLGGLQSAKAIESLSSGDIDMLKALMKLTSQDKEKDENEVDMETKNW